MFLIKILIKKKKTRFTHKNIQNIFDLFPTVAKQIYTAIGLVNF
jgi:hypothetical protein